jgi:group I intron endonuclease
MSWVKYKHAYYFIYMTKNIENNKCYIGWHATNNLNDGYVGSGKLLRYSINKYGEDKHITGILEFCNKNEVYQREKYWIKKKNTIVPVGYNLTRGGDGGNTYILLSEEDKKKFKEQCSKQNRGRSFSEEHKKKISDSKKGKASPNKGVKFSDETKQKMSKAWRTREPVSKETKEKHRQNRLGKKHLPETLEKMSKKYKCKYCGKETNKSNLMRHENNYCNSRPI